MKVIMIVLGILIGIIAIIICACSLCINNINDRILVFTMSLLISIYSIYSANILIDKYNKEV
jgi:hypothetical protein